MSTGKKPALGQGLAALLSPHVNAGYHADSSELSHGGPNDHRGTFDSDFGDEQLSSVKDATTKRLPLSALIPSHYQPRQHFDGAELESLAQSVRQHGILQPVLVRPTQQTDTYEIVAGERRWRASKIAGVPDIPVIIRDDISDQQALELGLLENIQRHDLTIIEEARGYQRLMKEFGYTQDTLSHTLGKSRSHIANVLRLLGLPENIQDLVSKGKISFGHARTLVGLTPEQSAWVLEAVLRKNLTVRQTEKLVRKAISQGNSGEDVGRRSDLLTHTDTHAGAEELSVENDVWEGDLLAISQYVMRHVPANVVLKQRNKKFQMTLDFENMDGVDRLMETLSAGFKHIMDNHGL
ncbi:MAG: ParB/RepB/Spo0J family partition protein [Alphaproteobacteria bacterium]|nr:MAG: ParB/RepB/Spo0J family partition protein [Alphaproteobacteria bacterium]